MMKKRILGIVLSVCMLASAISINPISSEAAEVTNVAKGKQGYASTEASGTLVNLTDGDTDSYNEYASAPRLDEASQWVAVDLGGTYVINKVTLCTNYDQGLPSEFSILAYNGEKWIEVYYGTAPNDGSDKAKGNPFTFEAVMCSAVKVIASRPSMRNYSGTMKYVFRLAELQVYGVASDQTLAAPTFGDYTTNIASVYNGTTISDASIDEEWAEYYSALLEDGYPTYCSRRAIDNVYVWNTYHGYWYGDKGADKQNTPMGMTLNFNKPYRINQITLEPAYSAQAYQGGFPEDFILEALTSEGWKTVVSRTGFIPQEHSNQYRYKRNFYFPDVDCMAVRLTTSKNGAIESEYGIRLGEFAVYGVEAPAWSTNIATSATVKTSHLYDWYEDHGLKLERVNDGNTSKGRDFSFWASQNVEEDTPITLSLEFDKVYAINKIKLDPAYTWSDHQGGFPEAFTISAFTENGWETIISDSNVGQVTDWKTYEFPEVNCTAVKLTTIKNGLCEGTKYALRLGEFEVYGAESDAIIDLYPATYSDVQTKGTAFASTSRNTTGSIKLSALNDGVASPLWDAYSSDFFSNPVGGQYAGVRFDKAYWFNEVIIHTYPDWLPESFRISVYDGNEWVEVVCKTDYAAEGTAHVFAFEEICGSAVKITADKMKKVSREGESGYGIEIAEMVIKGVPSSNTVEQPVTDLFNISSGMEVTVGSIVDWTAELNNPNNLIDNNRNTLYFSDWSPSADNCEWVQITFDAPMTAHYMDIYPWAEADIAKRFPKDFEIQAYTGIEWTTVLSMTDYEITQETYAGGNVNGANTTHPFRFCFAPIECSAIRFVATELDTTNLENQGKAFGLLILDMNIYGENANNVVEKPGYAKRGHQAPAAVVLSKGTNNDMLNDGDRTSSDNNYTSELVNSSVGTVSMQFVFERPTNVDRIKFFPTDNSKFPTEFKVYAYTAGGWTLIKEAKDYTDYITGGFKLFSFEEVCCSSIVIQMSGLSELNGQCGVQLKDIDITGAIGTDTGVVLADGNGDDKLTEVDVPYVRQELLQDEQSGKYDFNMDATVDVRDLVRTKVYFANKN